MLTQVAGPLRVARAGLVAALVLALAVLAHLAGGGTLPHPLILAALASFAMAGATFAARCRLTFGRLVVVLGTGQVALHYGLGFSANASCASAAAAQAGHAGHTAASQVTSCAVLTPLPDGVAHLPHETPAGAWMLLAHVAATLVVALVVAHGERALGLLLTWLAPRSALAQMLPALPVLPRLLAPAAAPTRAATALRRIPTTRGPPLAARLVALPS